MKLVGVYNSILLGGILCIWGGGVAGKGIISGLIEHNIFINSLILMLFIVSTIWVFTDGVGLFSKIRLLSKLKLSTNNDDGAGYSDLSHLTSKVFGRKFYHAIFAKNEYGSVFNNWKDSLEWKPRVLEYISGTLIGLGLLGTFIGLMRTLGNVFGVLSQDIQGKELVSALGEPLAGMSVAFSASMLGLGTSLITGLIAMVVAKIISEYTKEVENWLHLNVKEELPSGRKGGDLRGTVSLMKDVISLLKKIKEDTVDSKENSTKSKMIHEEMKDLIQQIEINTRNLNTLDELIIKTNIDVKKMLIQNNQRIESVHTMVDGVIANDGKDKADFKLVKNKIDELNQNIIIKNNDIENIANNLSLLKSISESSLNENIATRTIVEATLK